MNRTQRAYGRLPKTFGGEGPFIRKKKKKKKGIVEIEEVLPPRWRRNAKNKIMATRCCYITPEHWSDGQLTDEVTDSVSQCQIIETLPYRSVPSEVATAQQRSPSPAIEQPELTTTNEPPLETTTKQPGQTTIIRQPPQTTANCTIFNKRPELKRHKSITAKMSVHATPKHSVGLQSQKKETKTSLRDELMMKQLDEIHMLMCAFAKPTVETSCQYQPGHAVNFAEALPRQTEDVAEIELRDEETLTKYHNVPKKLHISEVPRIKLMAVKFTKYNKHNIEIRRVDEKVVCVEYDVFDQEIDDKTPVQKIRAFFSIKPEAGTEANELPEIPATVKNQFNISSTDLQKLSKKEIEMIDGTIQENKPYLDDLKKIIRRQENSAKINKNNLNLQALYEMGKRDLLDFDTNVDANSLTKQELVEVQNIILQNCKSSVHGIKRMTVKNNSKIMKNFVSKTLSRSLIAELLKESKETMAV